MRILLIHQAFVSPDQAGGTRHYELAQHMARHGHDFTIVASDLSYLTGARAVAGKKGLVSRQVHNGVTILRAYTYPALHRSFVWRVISFLSFMMTSLLAGLRAGPVDLVMGTTPPIFQAASAWLVAWLRRRPFLLEVRDLWPEFAIDMGVLTNPLLIALSRALEAFLYARATHVLVNSPAYREYLIAKGVAPGKVSLIPNGVSPELFDPNEDGTGLRTTLGLADRFIITYAGAMGMANDLEAVLRAAQRLADAPHIHFLFVGDGKERTNLQAISNQLELTNVTFTGAFPKSQMSAVLAASDACLAILRNIPMFRTTYPNKVFDYMAAGRPTILAIDGVIRQVIEAAGGGIFVPPGEDAALAAAARALASDPERARAMGATARAYVVQHFNRHQQAQEFEQLVAQLAQRKS